MATRGGKLKLKPIKTNLTTTNIEEDEKSEMEPLSPGARVFNAPKTSSYIVAEMGCKTDIDVEIFINGANQTLFKHPRFTSKLVFDPKTKKPLGWIKTKLNVEEHLIIPKLDPNIESPDQFVEDYVSNITKIPMDFSKPLWEIHILHIKTSKANSVVIFRIHHSMGDGISLISLLVACTRKTSDPEALPTLHADKKAKNNNKKKNKTQTSNGLLTCLYNILLILKYILNTMVDLLFFLFTMIWLKDTNTPVKGPPGTEHSRKRFVHRSFSLEDVKLVKNSLDTTVNDVVLGITQAGLSRYLNRSYGKSKGDENENKNNLPKNIRLRATLLVNLRPTTTIEALADLMEADFKGKWQWGNTIGYIVMPFHIALKEDPLEHIRVAKATIDRKKESFEAPSGYVLAKCILKVLGLKVTSFLTHRVLTHTTMSFSNVIGPTDEVSFHGHPLAYLAPSVYGHPQALTVHFQSYMDTMMVVLAVDEDVVPDPHKLCDDIVESLHLAKTAILERNLTNS